MMRDLAIKLPKDTDGAYDQWGYRVKGRYTHLYPFAYNNGSQPTKGISKPLGENESYPAAQAYTLFLLVAVIIASDTVLW